MAAGKTPSRFGRKRASVNVSGKTGKKSGGHPKSSKASGEKPNKKPNLKSAAKYSSLKSKQMAVENAKRLIWAAVQGITKALITNATTGNLSTAKELFDFAGVYSLAESDDDSEAAAAAVPAPVRVLEPAAAVAEPAPAYPIDAFFRKIGIEPSTGEPESEAA
jgi:hypothetical protein